MAAHAINGRSIPRFPAHVQLRYDNVRSTWTLFAPEKLFSPNPTALEMLRLIDGIRTVETIVNALADQFDAPRAEIETDVFAVLEPLVASRLLLA